MGFHAGTARFDSKEDVSMADIARALEKAGCKLIAVLQDEVQIFLQAIF
ncbi:MAG: hypothetical protein M3Y27_15185 [Acidobacteriota bacterium]|nr:hypothetical protein [Acidobacteriota bacterium]